MRRVGQTRRRDLNEKAIVDALRAIGADVTRVSGPGAPDVIARYRGQLYAFEIKSQKGTQTEAQRETQWPVIRSVSEALEAVGVTT